MRDGGTRLQFRQLERGEGRRGVSKAKQGLGERIGVVVLGSFLLSVDVCGCVCACRGEL